MSVEAELLEFMNESISVYARASVDNYGKESYAATATTVQCYIERQSRMVRNTEGREVIASARIYADTTSVAVTDRIVMPDGSTPIILNIATWVDEEGVPHHQEIDV